MRNFFSTLTHIAVIGLTLLSWVAIVFYFLIDVATHSALNNGAIAVIHSPWGRTAIFLSVLQLAIQWLERLSGGIQYPETTAGRLIKMISTIILFPINTLVKSIGFVGKLAWAGVAGLFPRRRPTPADPRLYTPEGLLTHEQIAEFNTLFAFGLQKLAAAGVENHNSALRIARGEMPLPSPRIPKALAPANSGTKAPLPVSPPEQTQG